MNLIKTSIYSSISQAIRIATAFIVNKMVAIFIGPSGLAILGNFQNTLNILSGLSTGAINSGVVKYTAEYANDPVNLKKLFSTSLRIVFMSSLIVSLITIFLSNYLSHKILHSTTYAWLFLLFGVSVFFYSSNTILLSVLNGKKEIRKFTIVNISSSILSLLLTSTLIYYKQLTGALFSLVIAQSCFFFITFFVISRCSWFSLSLFTKKISRPVIKNLSRFSAMGITSAIMVPLSLLFIRNLLISQVSADAAGYWEGITRISSNYLMLVTTTLSIYYLPKLSETHNPAELRGEIWNGYKIIMPIVIIGAAAVYIFRVFIIHLLFSHRFGPMEPLFLFQLVGDILKIASWLLAFLMLAKAMARMYIITEIIFNSTYVLLSWVFVHFYGLVGVTYAYATNYLLYFTTCYLLLRRKLRE